MKISSTIRRITTILLVVFVLTTIWAAYSLFVETRSPSSSTSIEVATYSQGSVNSFVAALAPSYLYNNSTEITGGNTTLFTPITNWINASLAYSFGTNRTATISLSEVIEVTLSTSIWSKVLFTTTNTTSLPTTTLATMAFQYDINVTSVVALAEAIDTQLGYFGSGYLLSITPEITGTVAVAGLQQAVAFEPQLNFTFSGSLIKPSGLAYASTGALYADGHVVDPDGAAEALLALGLAGSLAALGSCAWVVIRRADERPSPPLDEIIQPYEEAIAAVTEPPKGATTTAVATFGDLVKIADTLGKPILRPGSPDSARRTFFVVDGNVAYTYHHVVQDGTPPPPEKVTVKSPGLRRSPATSRLVQLLQQQVNRLRSLPLDEATNAKARQSVRRAMDLIYAGMNEEAADEIERLSRFPSVGGGLRQPPR
jgi:Family of unknown function (DUF5305)